MFLLKHIDLLYEYGMDFLYRKDADFAQREKTQRELSPIIDDSLVKRTSDVQKSPFSAVQDCVGCN